MFLHLELSRQVEERDDGGQVSALVETLQDELAARGVRAQLADPDDTKQYPRLELTIISSAAGNAALAYVTPFGRSGIEVACSLRVAAVSSPIFSGTIRATGTPGNAYSEDLAAPKAIAREIAEAVTDTD